MNVLAPGGAGYIGSHCVKNLVESGHRVTVLDNLRAGHREAVHRDAQFIQADLEDARTLREVFAAQQFDAVMHFAALLDVGESVREPLKYWRNNVVNTLNLLEAMHAAGVNRMVFSSTCAVYGVPERLPLTEEMPTRPINPYGATKLAVEQMFRHSAAAWGLGSIALRYFNASGAAMDGTLGEDHDPEFHLIPVVLQVAQGKRAQIKVFGTDYPTPDGSCVRDYIHVDDLARAHTAALEQLEPGRAEAYNVGTGRGASVLEIIEAARRVTGHAIPAEVTARRPGDPPELYADAGQIKARLNWSAEHTDIETVIRSAWSWFQAHPHGYAS